MWELTQAMHRWYDPGTGRWISEDPIGFAAGDANLYRYVGNGVTGAVDPSGLQVSNSEVDGYERLDFYGVRDGVKGAVVGTTLLVDNIPLTGGDRYTLGHVVFGRGKNVFVELLADEAKEDAAGCGFHIENLYALVNVEVIKSLSLNGRDLPLSPGAKKRVMDHEKIHLDAYQRHVNRVIEYMARVGKYVPN